MRRGAFHIDWKLILPVAILIFFSLTVLVALNPIFFRGQIVSVVVGFVFFILFSAVDYRAFKNFAIPFYVISLVLLALLFIVGSEARGATRWLEVGGITIQFSELLKPFLLLSFASWLVALRERFSLRNFLATLGVVGLPTIFVFLQPDLGNALIYGFVAFLTLIYIGFPVRYFLACIAFGILSFPVFWLLLRDYQRNRLLTFINPDADPLGVSYNSIQAAIAVGSGQLFGRGLGLGTQSQLRFLPERHTDFIFATLSEEFGFIGALVLIAVFGFLLWRIYIISREAQDGFGQIFAASAFCLILVQTFMNIGMNVGVVPIAGVTLPFVSYGGSSLVSLFIILGILSSISRTLKYKEPLEIR